MENNNNVFRPAMAGVFGNNRALIEAVNQRIHQLERVVEELREELRHQGGGGDGEQAAARKR